jgi:dienelactone hydrolase
MSGPIHSRDLERERAVRLSLRLLVGVLASWLVVLCCSCRTHSAATPKRASTLSRQVSLTGKAVPVDFYLPNGVSNAPVVVVAHGFTRSRLNMAGWGGLLASNGFIVAVPDLPALADHEQNSRAISELLEVINKGNIAAEPRPAGGAALVGFSMGGLSTLLAAPNNPNVRCWIGLDPVSAGSKGTEAAASLSIPCAVLRAEPAAWNRRGNARRLTKALSGPFVTLRVKDATHSDPENPTDSLAELLCGKSDARRRQTFERYTLATLRAVFSADPASLAILRTAEGDPAVADVASRRLEDFPAQGRLN